MKFQIFKAISNVLFLWCSCSFVYGVHSNHGVYQWIFLSEIPWPQAKMQYEDFKEQTYIESNENPIDHRKGSILVREQKGIASEVDVDVLCPVNPLSS